MTQIAVKGLIWSYFEIGEDSSQSLVPIVILHGWGRSGAEWVGMAESLSKYSGRKVYVVDLPGFGGSSLSRVQNIFEYSQLVKYFCSYLEIKKMILIGHSLGGRIGIVLASESTALLEKLVLIDPAGVKPRSLRRTALQYAAKIFGWVPSKIRKVVIEPFMDDDYKNSPALRQLYQAIVAADLTSKLADIECQTDLIWGELDQILPLELTRVYKKYLKKAKLRVVWGAGHDPHLSHFEQTKHLLEEAVE